MWAYCGLQALCQVWYFAYFVFSLFVLYLFKCQRFFTLAQQDTKKIMYGTEGNQKWRKKYVEDATKIGNL